MPSVQFFKNTIESKFIKYLLEYTPLPIFPTINSGEIMIEGCTYIYIDKILLCTKTGRFRGINANTFIDDYLYVNEDLYVTDDDYVLARRNPLTGEYNTYLPDEKGIGGLTVTDDYVRYEIRPVAEYEIVDNFIFGQFVPNVTQRFVSNTSYYDFQTHKFLGDYLRCLRDIYGLDLMGLYNCFDNYSVSNISLSLTGVTESTPVKSKVFLIPIKFNKVYTIALNSNFPVLAKAIFYKNHLLVTGQGVDLTSLLQSPVTQYNSLLFNSPVTFSVTNNTDLNTNATTEAQINQALAQKRQTDKLLQDYEKYLYLAIQISENNETPIVVIEGDYSSVASSYVVSADGINTLSQPQISSVFRSNLSLLEQTITTDSVPFSDKLISYLLQYTIDVREEIDDNVARVETDINYNPPIKNFKKGMWDVNLRYVLYNKYMNIQNIDFINKQDIIGFVDRDIENATLKGWIKYGV